MITVEDFDLLVSDLRRRPVPARFAHSPWARMRPESVVAYEAVGEAVEDLVADGSQEFTVQEVKAAMDPRFFNHPTHYQGPRHSTVESGLRKLENAGVIRARRCKRRVLVYEISHKLDRASGW